MSLGPGDKLGSYEILALIGQGGMGVVYRAHDSKLNRDVAIKVLPPNLASDADYRTRFEREAQSLAALNHPNIAAIYGLEGDAIIMELVEGDTLQTPLPIAEALPIARQIAEALEAAHDKGIIHRDLKPANIKLTPDGAVKVLDFGLAKSIEKNQPACAPPSADSPTIRATQAGLILGTAGYMSPEQAAGKPVDRRADIWAYGVVLYEMLVGSRLFDGETLSHTLADVLRKDIDLSLLPQDTPPAIRELLRRCLDRNLKNRLSHIAEARYAIDNAAAPQSPSQPAPTAAPSSIPWAIAAVFAIIATALAFLHFTRKPPALAPLRAFSFSPTDITDVPGIPRAAISPDGSHIAYIAASRIWLRPLASENAHPLTGTEAAEGLFWSPDNTEIAFITGGELKKVPISGGTPFTVTRITSGYRGGAWSPDGKFILISSIGSGLAEVPAEGGTPKVVNKSAGSVWFSPIYLPTASPKRLVVAARGGYQRTSLELIDLNSGNSETLRPDGASPAWSPLGYLLYQTSATAPGLWAWKFSPTTGKPLAEPVAILNTGSSFSVASDGALLWLDASSFIERQLTWRSRTGQKLSIQSARSPGPLPAISPDGTQVAYPSFAEFGEIWVAGVANAVHNRLTFNTENDSYPVWSPNGKELIFAAQREGNYNVVAVPSGGGADPRPVMATPLQDFPTAWSPDGTILLVTSASPGTGLDLFSVSRKPDGSFAPPVVWLQSPANELNATFSPDGQYVAYTSDVTGHNEVFLRHASGSGGQWQVSLNGGATPRWNRNGRELFYQQAGSLWAVPLNIVSGVVHPGTAVELFRNRSFVGTIRYWDVHPDGNRFLISELGETESKPPSIHVILNWPNLLPR